MIKPILQLLVGAMAIGLAPIFARLAVTDASIGPIAAGFWRMFVGAIGFLAMLQLTSVKESLYRSISMLLKKSHVLAMTAGLMFALDLASWHTSFAYTSLASSTLIANLSAVFVPLTGVLFFKEKLKPKLAIGGITAMLGVVGLTLFKPTAGRDATHDSIILGEGLAFLTAFFYTAYMISIKKLAAAYPARILMLVSSAISAVFLLVISISVGELILPTNNLGWLWILGLGLVSQVLGQGLIAKALSVLPVGQSALILLSAPASTAMFSWVFLGERLDSGALVSVFITLLGIAIVARR